MISFKDHAKIISFIILVSLASWVLYYTFFNFIPAKLNEAEDKAKQIIKATLDPRFRCEQFDLGEFKFIYEVKDTKNKVTYIIFRDFKGTVLLSKEPTSATNATLLEELKMKFTYEDLLKFAEKNCKVTKDPVGASRLRHYGEEDLMPSEEIPSIYIEWKIGGIEFFYIFHGIVLKTIP